MASTLSVSVAAFILVVVMPQGLFAVDRNPAGLNFNPRDTKAISASAQKVRSMLFGCPGLEAGDANITCKHGKLESKLGQGIDCTEKVPVNTKVYFINCQPGYGLVEDYQIITCKFPGKWDNDMFTCDEKPTEATTTAKTNTTTKKPTSTIKLTTKPSNITTKPSNTTTKPSNTTLSSSNTTTSINTAAITVSTASTATTSSSTNISTTNTSATVATASTVANAVTTATAVTDATTATLSNAATTTTTIATVTTPIPTLAATTPSATTTATTTVAAVATVPPPTTTIAPVTTAAIETTAAATTTTVATTTIAATTTLDTPTTTQTTTTTNATAPPIPPSFVKVTDVGLVKQSTGPKTRRDALADCLTDGANLFVVDTPAKMNLMTTFTNNPAIYVGAVNAKDVWSGVVKNGTVWKNMQGVAVGNLPVFKWIYSRPVNDTLFVVYSRESKAHWDVLDNNVSLPYMCEKPL